MKPFLRNSSCSVQSFGKTRCCCPASPGCGPSSLVLLLPSESRLRFFAGSSEVESASVPAEVPFVRVAEDWEERGRGVLEVRGASWIGWLRGGKSPTTRRGDETAGGGGPCWEVELDPAS